MCLSRNDLATVRDGEPAYLLMIDGFIIKDPDNTDLLLAGARLYDTSYRRPFCQPEDELILQVGIDLGLTSSYSRAG